MDPSRAPKKVRGQISGETWLSRVGVRQPRKGGGRGHEFFEFGHGHVVYDIPEWQNRMREGYLDEMAHIVTRYVRYGQLPEGNKMYDHSWERQLRGHLWWRVHIREAGGYGTQGRNRLSSP